MEKMIAASAELMIRPLIEEIRQVLEEEIRAESLIKGGMPKPEKSIQKEAREGSIAFKKFLLAEEELSRIEKGFRLFLKELADEPNREAILEEIGRLGKRLSEEPGPSEEFEPQVYDSIQEMFGLSQETYQAMYKIATRYFNEGKRSEALNLFALLTALNQFVFEPWLGLGSCWQAENRLPEALYAFTMASLVQFNHPAPHLYSAEVYLQLGDKQLARETLQLALSKMSDQQKELYKPHIVFLKNHTKTKGV